MRARSLATVVVLAILICMIFSTAHADRKMVGLDNQVPSLDFSKAVPGQLNYQGFLVDAADSSAVTATLEMTFRLFDSETKGAELWSETHSAVEVNNGLFQVLLGSVTPFSDGFFDGTDMWLQTEVGAELLTPRKPLVSTAYSHRANSAEMLLDYTLTDLDDRWVNEDQASSVTSAMIADGEIADTDVAPGAAIAPDKIDGTAWTAGNDGAGSGLDADMVDGQHAADFIGMGDLDHLNAADGDPANAVYVDTAGKVGIGTISPLTELDVNGSVNATTYFGDGSNLTGISGGTDGDWTIDGSDMYAAVPGNVGIGVVTPSAKLHVVDASGNYAVIGNAAYGVYGRDVSGDNFGYLGGSGHGVYGKDNDTGTYGYLGGGGYGVYGHSSVPKENSGLPTPSSAVYGEAQGSGASGVYGIHTDSGNLGVLGHPDYAGYFDGDVYVTGDVGIGVMPSAYPLNVAGMANMLEIRMPTGAVDGYMLTSDAAGVGTWQPGWWLREEELGSYWISARNAPSFRVYDDSTIYIGLCFVQNCSTGAVTNWWKGSTNVKHCYTYPGQAYGTYGYSNSGSNDVGIYGLGDEWGGYFDCLSGGVAVYGESDDPTRYGMMGTPDFGAYGQHETGNFGLLGSNTDGVFGESNLADEGKHGVFGYQSTNTPGSGYYHLNTHCGVLGRSEWGLNYNCGVQGAMYLYDAGNRISGVIGIFTDNYSVWGSLAYQSSGGSAYGGYLTSYGSGTGKSDGASTGIGLGAWGDLFGADIHGRVYGTYTEGDNYGLYSHGIVFRDNLDVHLQDTGGPSASVLYTNVSTHVTVQTSGYCQLSEGVCSVGFDENFQRVVSPDVPIVVTVTPMGSSNGVHLDRVDKNGFTVVENNAGKSDAQVAFIAIGRRAGYEAPQLPEEVVSSDYAEKLSRGLHNDADTVKDGQGLYYENGQLYVGIHPSLLIRADKSEEEERYAEIRRPERPKRVEDDQLGRDNRAR